MADEITDEQIAELRRLHEAATPGPLTYFTGNANRRGLVRVETAAEAPVAGIVLATATRGREADVAALVAARNALPALLSRLERAAARIATLEAALREVVDRTEFNDAKTEKERDWNAAVARWRAALRGTEVTEPKDSTTTKE